MAATHQYDSVSSGLFQRVLLSKWQVGCTMCCLQISIRSCTDGHIATRALDFTDV